MKKTQVDFMLTVSQLFQKLENGEDCKKECEQVARMNDEQKESVSDQLLDRLQSRDSKEVDKLVAAAKQVGYLDPDYIDDFAAVIREPFAPSTLQERQEIVKRVLSRTGYGQGAHGGYLLAEPDPDRHQHAEQRPAGAVHPQDGAAAGRAE